MSKAVATGAAANLPGWQVIIGEKEEKHVMPLADRLRHDGAATCACSHQYDEGIWVHNSYDRREMFER